MYKKAKSSNYITGHTGGTPVIDINIQTIPLKTKKEFQFIDLTKKVNDFIKKNKVKAGQITISTQHTTTAIVVNEKEQRLLRDFKNFLFGLAPERKNYLHDDIEKRPCPPNEPLNACPTAM